MEGYTLANWPAGHRWEDYHVSILDKDRAHLGDLETCHRLAGNRRQYGQFGCQLTLSLHKDDPWASVLLERELHYIQVLRDGRVVFEGYQIKLDRSDTVDSGEQWIEFEFLPIAFKLGWRHGQPVNPGAVFATNDLVDDGFKFLIERTHGASAPNTPSTGLSRVEPGWTIAANKSEGPGPYDLVATGRNMYEFCQQFGATYLVDFDVYFNAAWQTVFETWYPRRGVNRVEGTGDGIQVVFSDEQGQFSRQSYGHDTSKIKTVAYNRMMTADICPSPTRRTNWGHREVSIDTMDAVELPVGLQQHVYEEWYRVEEFVETEDRQWGLHWNVGDTITWRSNRLGYGPHNDIICEVAFEIIDGGKERLSVTFGKPEPDILDNLRGGGQGSNRPYYDAPIIPYEADPAFTFGAAHAGGVSGHFTYTDSIIALGITAPDANTVYPAVAGPNRWSLTSLGNTITITAAVASTVNFEVAAAALPYAVPALTFGAAHAAGAANTVIRSDAIVALGITAPDANTVYPNAGASNRWSLTSTGGTITITAAVANSVNFEMAAAALPFAVPAITTGAAYAAGAANTVVRSDCVLQADAPVNIGNANAAGVGTHFVRNDHVHNHPAGLGTGLHHAEAHIVNSTGPHAEAGLTIGHVLTATGAAVFTFALPAYSGNPGTCTVATGNAAGANHTHAITTSSNPGAAASILASGANGYLQLVGLGVGSAATAANRVVYGANGAYIDGPNPTYLRYDAPLVHLWSIGGTNELALQPTELYPIANNDIILGRAAQRYGNVYSVLGNFSDTVTTGHLTAAGAAFDVGSGTRYRDGLFSRNLDVDGTGNVQGAMTMQAAATVGTTLGVTGLTTCSGGLAVTGNITVTGTVDGVDISVFKAAYDIHTHAISGNTGAGAAHTHTASGHTDGWTTVGARNPLGNILYRYNTSTVIYVPNRSSALSIGALYVADDVAGTNARWEAFICTYAAVGTTEHYHTVGTVGSSNMGGTSSTFANANEATHVHNQGTLVTAAP